MDANGGQDVLGRNLVALGRVDRELAERLSTEEGACLDWAESKTGLMTAAVQREGRSLSLASRYDPVAEGARLAETVDYAKQAGVVVLGFGLGHHVAEVVRRAGDRGLVIVYEPDPGLLRAVLERVDHSAWLGRGNVVVVCGEADRAKLLRMIEPFAGMLTMGTVLVTHPPSRQLWADRLAAFGKTVTEVLAFCRTNVATAMVNATRTYRNLSANLPHYAAGAGTDELHHAAAGYPAVCVGAGPSLAKNVQLLGNPAVRRRVVVISAQTTLKVLLDRGVRPDFVTALDYHEISRRFYEGLDELPDVTLVAEPMAHPTILDSFPGPIRVTANKFLDRLLGDMARPMVPIPYGATVAHLSFYLAQHLGCDPIVFVGQDLGFSDGLYYCPGTAIHGVWAPELNAFNTVEMMEWQRVVRHRNHLRKVTDVHGRDIYSDEQMQTYLGQFERDFAKATQTVIDATEGGQPKEHTRRMRLSEALEAYATREVPGLPLPPRGLDRGRLSGAAGHVRERREQVAELRRISVNTVPLLKKMRKDQRDARKMKKHFDKLEPLQRRVDELSEAFCLVNDLNTVGAFNRAKADRAIDVTGADEYETQRQRLERDIRNVEWLIQACDEVLGMFDEAVERVGEQLSGEGDGGGVVAEVVAGSAGIKGEKGRHGPASLLQAQ